MIHTRAADDDTAAALAGFDGRVVLHCFSSPALLPVALERGYYVSFAGNVTFPKASDLRVAAQQVPGRPDPRRDRHAVPRSAARPRPEERAGLRRAHARRRSPRRATWTAPSARGADRRERRRALFGLDADASRPRKELGQHFLVDENLLGVIGRLAELDPADVVLEIGPGLGVLTRYLAERVSLVHAVEIDRSLEPHLPRLPNVRIELGDALRLDLADLDPPPGKLVSNLPYNVATPIVVESLDGLPAIERWCVMVQREVADRFFAVPGTKAYGAVSVLVQLAAERTGLPRGVAGGLPAAPERRLGARRVSPPAAARRVRRRQARGRGAFAHRRKTLPNSIELAGLATRARAQEALAALGVPAATRAEALEPAAFVELERLLR